MEFLRSLGIESQGILKKPPKDTPETVTIFPLQKSFSGQQNYYAQSSLQIKERKPYYHEYSNYNALSNDFQKRTRQLIRHFRPNNFCSKKFSVKMFFYLLELSLANAEILYSIRNEKNIIISKEFRLIVAKSLLRASSSRTRFRPILIESQITITQTHMPNKDKKRGFCDFCKKSKVNTFCTHCRTFLCIKDCFQEYHNRIFKISEHAGQLNEGEPVSKDVKEEEFAIFE
jgi:hypothetical protein